MKKAEIIDFWNVDDSRKRVHFIGIGGIGMSALARWFLSQGWSVSGSDLAASAITSELEAEGVNFYEGHRSEVPEGALFVVASSAVLADNPERLAASRSEVSLYTYPKVVGEISRRYETVAVAGAHGKSTTTALTSIVLMDAGVDPTVMVGTKMKELDGSNFRSGQSRYLVLEADEYAKAFLNYSPAFLAVTNIDREHLDIYRDLADIKKTFLKLFRRVLSGGALVLNADDPNLLKMRPAIEKIAKKNYLSVFWYSLDTPSGSKVEKALAVPGKHNVSNALAAFTMATKVFELEEADVLGSLGRFQGSWRRYEYKGQYSQNGIDYKVFDDYAHHPTEIRASLSAFKEKFPDSGLICVFQPHQSDRLRRLFNDFAAAFEVADAVVFLPAYKVAGREQSQDRHDAQALAALVARENPKQTVLYLPRPEEISRSLISDLINKEDSENRDNKKISEMVVVMMGAGNIPEYTPLLLSESK